MATSFLREYFNTESTSWECHFCFIEKMLTIPGYTGLKKSSKCGRFLRILIICMLPVFSLCSILNETNPQHRFDSILAFSIGVQTLSKFSFLWLLKTKREKLSQDIIETTSSLYASAKHLKEIGRKYRMQSITIVGSATILYILAATAYITLPLFALVQRKLPLQAPIVGVSFQHHPGYEINYSLIILQSIFFMPCIIGFDLIFYLFCLYTVLRFEICSRLCDFIGDDKTNEYNCEKKQKKHLQNLIKIHSESVDFLTEFKNIFEKFVLINISTFMVISCICIVQIFSKTQLSAYFGLSVIGIQLLLYSTFGQLIISKRKEFATAIYCSKWYELSDISNRKMVLLMLINAQKSEGITLKGFTELSLDAYSQMVKMCYSFAAFLMKLM